MNKYSVEHITRFTHCTEDDLAVIEKYCKDFGIVMDTQDWEAGKDEHVYFPDIKHKYYVGWKHQDFFRLPNHDIPIIIKNLAIQSDHALEQMAAWAHVSNDPYDNRSFEAGYHRGEFEALRGVIVNLERDHKHGSR